MSIATTTVSQTYVANGVNTAFAIPFPIIQSDTDEVKVWKRDESVSPVVPVLLVAGVDYNLTGRPTPSDFQTTVTFLVAPANLLKIIVERVVPLQQPFSPISNGSIILAEHERAYDRAVAILQQLDAGINRAIGFDRTSPYSGYKIPDPQGGKLLGFSVDGLSLKLFNAADIVNVANALAVANNLSDLSNVSAALINLGISPLSTQRKFAFTDGQAATNLTGETYDGAVYTSIVYEYEVIRGTTVFANGRLMLQYLNGTWGVVDDGFSGNLHGLTFSLTQVGAVAQLRLAASSSGGGNGFFKAKTHRFGI